MLVVSVLVVVVCEEKGVRRVRVTRRKEVVVGLEVKMMWLWLWLKKGGRECREG